MQDATRRAGTPSTSGDGQPRRWFRDVYRDAIWEAEDLSATEKAVAETYMRHARDERGNKSADADLSWLTYERLMAKAGIHRRANVPPAIAKLVKHGWMEPVEQTARRPTLYRLTIPTGGSDPGTTTDAARSSDPGTTVVPAVVPPDPAGSSTLSGLPHPRSSDPGTPPLVTPLKEHHYSTSYELAAEPLDDQQVQEEVEEIDPKIESDQLRQQTETLIERHAPGLIGLEHLHVARAVKAALKRGWSEEIIGNHLAKSTAGTDSAAAVLITRMQALSKTSPETARPWCGKCDQRTRKVGDFSMYGGHPIERPCPRCSGNAKTPQSKQRGDKPWNKNYDDQDRYDKPLHRTGDPTDDADRWDVRKLFPRR